MNKYEVYGEIYDEVYYEVYSLKYEYNLNDKEIRATLRKLTKNYTAFQTTQRCIEKLSPTNKKRVKENVLAAIQRGEDVDHTKNHFISTFIVAFLFLFVGECVNHLVLLSPFFIIFFLSLITSVAIYCIVKDFKKKNNIYLYKLIKYIENMDTDI